jgi:hypothetical protein
LQGLADTAQFGAPCRALGDCLEDGKLAGFGALGEGHFPFPSEKG